MADTLTDEMIAESMARGEKVACSPGNARCFALPDPLIAIRDRTRPMSGVRCPYRHFWG
jgi:hypothetical protein